MQASLKVKGFLLIFLTALCWGPNFLFIKVAVAEIPPTTLVFLRVGIGTAVLFSIALLNRIDLWKWNPLWKEFIVMAMTMNVIPYILISWGEQYISSALTGILNSLSVISVAVMAHYFGQYDRLTKNRIGGICSGVLGLVIIYLPILLHDRLGNILGALMMVGACLSYGVGTVYVRVHLKKMPVMAAITIQMVTATLILSVLALLIDRPFGLPIPSADAIYSVIALGAIGTGIGFIFYYKAIEMAGATYATLSVFLLAIFAMFYGAFFLQEQITWNQYLGAFFILLGLLAVNPAFDPSMKHP